MDDAGSWFLVSWPDRGRPYIEMEFETREEAQAALDVALRVCLEIRGGSARMMSSVCPGAMLLGDPFLQQALVEWDEHIDELERVERQVLRGG
jgi:hypothetical protein